MKKSFTLLEVIFVVVLIAIIATIAFPKLFLNITNASFVKIQSDVALIRSAIVQNRNQNIISGKGEAYMAYLDSASINTHDEKLFVGFEDGLLLQHPIISTSNIKKEIGRWIKTSNYYYEVHVNNLETVAFTYDNETGTFDCDYKVQLCKDLMK